MRICSTRTNGSYVQKKGSSIVWNHQHADPEFGAMQARCTDISANISANISESISASISAAGTRAAVISWRISRRISRRQARELQYQLQGVLAAFPVTVISGKGYVEVTPKGINKVRLGS